MSTEIKFNINCNVRVRLTPEGIEALRKNHVEIYGRIPEPALKDWQKFRLPEVDKDGYSRFQLWSLMQQLGPHISMTGPNLFDTEIIIEVGPQQAGEQP